LGILEFGDRIQVILRAIQSGNRRDMDNAVEAIESSLHVKIRRLLIPLLENRPMEEKLEAGRKWLGAHRAHLAVSASPDTTLAELTGDADPFAQTLAVYALASRGEIPASMLSHLLASPDPMVREAAQWANRKSAEPVVAGKRHARDPGFGDLIRCVRQVPIFADLPIKERMAVASIASIQYSEEKEIVVHEGDPGDALYLVLEGRLAVIQADSARGEVKLDTITEGGFFGEMALIDGNPRSATVRSETPSVLLRITGKEFERIIKDFPAVPINVCRVFMRRIRDLHSHLQAAPRRVPAMPP
jgi:hypothetical protein